MKVSEFLEMPPGEQSAFVAREILNLSGTHEWYEQWFNVDTPDAMMRTVEYMKELEDYYAWDMAHWSASYVAKFTLWEKGHREGYTFRHKSAALAVHIAAGLALGVLEEG